MNKCSGIILAAGEGNRAGVRKQFELLNGISMLQRVQNNMETSGVFSEIKIVVPIDMTEDDNLLVGGSSRIESLLQGVLNCTSEYVIFTDACRVYTPAFVFEKLYEAILLTKILPIVVMQKVNDSVISLGDMKWQNFPREILRRIQTPNAFPRKLAEELLLNMVEQRQIHESCIGWYIQKYRNPVFYTDDFYNEKITTKSQLKQAKEFFGKQVNDGV